MQTFNYVPLQTAHLDTESTFFDDLLDLDILRTEEGIFINIPERQ